MGTVSESINLASTVHPTLVILRPPATQLVGLPKPFPVDFQYKLPVLKSLKGPQNLNKQHLALVLPIPLAKKPQAWH